MGAALDDGEVIVPPAPAGRHPKAERGAAAKPSGPGARGRRGRGKEAVAAGAAARQEAVVAEGPAAALFADGADTADASDDFLIDEVFSAM